MTDERLCFFDEPDRGAVYGKGSADQPYLYDAKRPGAFLIGEHDDELDLPRNPQDIALIGDPRVAETGPAPLWYYVLREAQVRADGEHLGPVGGRIVAEVFLGLLRADPSSYLRNDPGWTPFLPSIEADDFSMPDLIAFSGFGSTRSPAQARDGFIGAVSPARRFEDKAVPGAVFEPRSAAALGREFPYRLATMCYLEVLDDGTVLWGGGRESYERAVAGESRLFAVWPGEWSSHLFRIDDLEVFARAVGIVYDPKWTGLVEHRHEVRWDISETETKPTAAYVTIDLWLDCGCEILELETFARQMREQQGWDVATSGEWGGSAGRHHVRVRRKSLSASDG